MENLSLSYSQTFTNANRNVNLAQYTGLTAGTTYSISVSVFYNSTFGPYGPACQITTPAAPTASLLPQYCGYTPSSYSELLTATSQVGTSFKFKMENVSLGYSQIFTNANKNVNLVQYSGLTAGTTYSLSVSVFFNGAYGPYGPACQITVPSSSPTTSVVPGNCGYTPSTYRELMYVTSVSGVTGYDYKLVNAALSISQTFTNVNQNFNFAVYSGLPTNTTFTVSARVKFMGVWGAYGPTCTVTTPASSARMLDDVTVSVAGLHDNDNSLESAFDAVAYPNPYIEQFSINLLSYTVNDKVSLRVFDATGKLIEQHDGTPGFIHSLTIGENYAAGIYNIVLTQGGGAKSIKVIKP